MHKPGAEYLDHNKTFVATNIAPAPCVIRLCDTYHSISIQQRCHQFKHFTIWPCNKSNMVVTKKIKKQKKMEKPKKNPKRKEISFDE